MTKTIHVYTVDADAETGEWIGEPESTGETVPLDEWDRRTDHESDGVHIHHDTYEVLGSDDPNNTVTRAIIVRQRILPVYWTNDLSGTGGPSVGRHALMNRATDAPEACTKAARDLASTADFEPGDRLIVEELDDGENWMAIPDEWSDSEAAAHFSERGVHPDDVIITRPGHHPGPQHQAWVTISRPVYGARIVPAAD
ncbi:MAG: hypothetical protein OXC11_14235 [Rhodospirillales bacterium]|nr:hypothetical protein [Rhodospirillales bacterium]